MAIWELESNSSIYTMMNELIERYHPHLSESKIILYANEKNKLKSNHVIIASASKASSRLRASTEADFTITIHMMPWGDLSESQKRACLDHELSHCGVHYEPVKEQVGTSRNGRPRMKVVRDSYGRIQYTDEIKRDPETGKPKWRLITHDLEEFRDIVDRHGVWDSSLQSFQEVLRRKDNN